MVVEEELHVSRSPLDISIKRQIEEIINRRNLEQIKSESNQQKLSPDKPNLELEQVYNPELYKVGKVTLRDNGTFLFTELDTRFCTCGHQAFQNIDNIDLCLTKDEVCLCDSFRLKGAIAIPSQKGKLPKKKEIIVEVEQDSRVNSYIHSLTKFYLL
jgi:hypothetical protein